jgi:hypothetical protein
MKSDNRLIQQKLELIQWLSSLEDVSLIEKIAELKDTMNNDWADLISPEEKIALDQGIKDATEGKISSHEKVRAAYEKWL